MAQCPNCGQASVGAYINLRRFYYPGAVMLDSNGDVTYEGWGEQTGDEIDYLICDECDSTWSEEEFNAFHASGSEEVKTDADN